MAPKDGGGTPAGPPISSRLAPEEVDRIVRPFGFQKTKFVDVGPYHYLLLLSFQGPDG